MSLTQLVFKTLQFTMAMIICYFAFMDIPFMEDLVAILWQV